MRKSTVLVILVILVTIIIALQPVRASAQLLLSPPTQINPDGSDVFGIKWSVTNGNAVYVTYVDGGELKFVKSTDGGESFDEPIEIGADTQSSGDADMIVENDNIYIVYSGFPQSPPAGTFSQIYFARSTDGGNTFSPPLDISEKGGGNPSLASNGNFVYVVWEFWAYPAIGATYFARSTDFGATFEPNVSLSNALTGTMWATIATQGTDVYVAWVQRHLGADFLFTRSLDNGQTFGDIMEIGTPGSQVFGAEDPQMLTDGDDSVYLLWRDYNDGDPFMTFRASHDRGASFEDAKVLAPSYNIDGRDLAIRDSEVYVALRPSEISGSGDLVLMRSTDGGNVFEEPVVLSSGESANDPRVAVTSSGTIHATWNDYQDEARIYVSSSEDGLTFSEAQIVASDALRSEIELSNDDRVYLMYSQPDPDTFNMNLLLIFENNTSSELDYSLQLFENDEISDGVVYRNQPVRAQAETNDESVEQVTFRWFSPGGDKVSEIVSPINTAEDSFAPDEEGTWTVEADFGNGKIVQKTLDISFFVLPESPVGAIAMLAASMAAFGGFLYFRTARRPLA